jgi:hypothetical protein
VVARLGYSAIVIEADPKAAGILSDAAGVLSRHGIVVRQALADDPDMIPSAKLTLVVEGQVPGTVLAELNSLAAVRSVTVMK